MEIERGMSSRTLWSLAFDDVGHLYLGRLRDDDNDDDDVDGDDGYFQVTVREVVRHFFLIRFWHGSLAK